MRVTEYTYDEGGRLIESRTDTEPEWDEQERAWMVALESFERESVCPACGSLKSVCQSPDAEFCAQVPAPTRCHFTTAVELASEGYKDARVPRALMFGVQMKPTTAGLTSVADVVPGGP